MDQIEDSIECVENPVQSTSKQKLIRCMEWLENQNELKKVSTENGGDIKFFTESSASRNEFLLSGADDDTTVPDVTNEHPTKPKAVPLQRLRVTELEMICEWEMCKMHFSDYELFQKHVAGHSSELRVTDPVGKVDYACLWDVCGHKTSDLSEMVRHINYHAYHARLLAIGFNGRATLKLERCRRDSSKRNHLPPLKYKHCCLWVDCGQAYNSIQRLFDHVRQHALYAERLCSWGGCGAAFPRRSVLAAHVRTHTHERLIACYHCGAHFTCNGKLTDHLARQNATAATGEACRLCGALCASRALRRQHERQHVSAFACPRCDMSAPTPAALAYHMRYRHLPGGGQRAHACPHCPYRAITKSDLRKHIPIHFRKKKGSKRKDDKAVVISDEYSSEEEVKKKKVVKKKYACHICPEKEVKVYSRGTRLTTHLVKVHGAQWSFGHSRFRYQISEDGMYRLTTTRYEYEDISKNNDGYNGPDESLNDTLEFTVKTIAEATETTPKRFEISLKNNLQDDDNVLVDNKAENDKNEKYDDAGNNAVEIMMCDVDDDGNIINTETIQSPIITIT